MHPHTISPYNKKPNVTVGFSYRQNNDSMYQDQSARITVKPEVPIINGEETVSCSTHHTAMHESATGVVLSRVHAMKEGGIDLCSFAVGEPDFDTPEHIREAAKHAIDRGQSKYTDVNGIIKLRKAICDNSFARRDILHTPAEVLVCVGAKHALFNVAMTLFKAGDEVIIPSPCWITYPEQVRISGATPVMVDCMQHDEFRLTPDKLRQAITGRTKAIVLCAPCNPTGTVYNEDQLRELADVMREGTYWIIIDEIYVDLTYDNFVQYSLLKIAPDLRDRTIIVDGVSKRYAMTGWRIGWVIGPECIIKACNALQSHATTNTSTISQYAALAALTGPQQSISVMRDILERRRNYLVKSLNTIPEVYCTAPRGAFYVLANVKGLVGKYFSGRPLTNDIAISRWLLEEGTVAVVPGSAFRAPGYLRFSFTLAQSRIEYGINNIRKAINTLTSLP